MVVPLIITGHTSCEGKSTIIDFRGTTDVISNVELCKKNNLNIEFYTIYSIDESIQDPKYVDYFDKVIYSENIIHQYVGEKVKVETALKYIMSEKSIEWGCFIKTTSSRVINNVEQYITMMDKYDYIGGNHETSVQYNTAMFIGNRKLVDTWITCNPKIEMSSNIKSEKDWLDLYGRLLLENLFYNNCKINNIKELLLQGLYGFRYI